MGKYVSAEQIADYSRDGVVCIKGLFKDWVPVISAGIERNMREPSRYA
ncbi:MAG: phytanoyl-CoA dioxygenase, partial [Alphaproteobacteria bacterium]